MFVLLDVLHLMGPTSGSTYANPGGKSFFFKDSKVGCADASGRRSKEQLQMAQVDVM